MITFTVLGRPVPKGRPRTVTGTDGRTRTYTPYRTTEYEDRVRWAAKEARVLPLSGDVKVTLRFYNPRNGSDADNLTKAFLDGAQAPAGFRYGCFVDDSQVVELHVYLIRDKTEQARTEIEVQELAS